MQHQLTVPPSLSPFHSQRTSDSGVIHLLVSHNRKAFKEAKIPSTEAHQNYIVSHINSLQALVIVEHTGSQYNLYLSDTTGVYYSLSLQDIVVENAVDLEVIEGVNGTLIANQYSRLDTSEVNAPMRTLISLDNGAEWELIRAPLEDVAGLPVLCEPPLCSLHFHMSSSEYARLGVYSQDSAPGIIVAHGECVKYFYVDSLIPRPRGGGGGTLVSTACARETTQSCSCRSDTVVWVHPTLCRCQYMQPTKICAARHRER